MSVRFRFKRLIFLVPASLVIYLIAYHVVNSKPKTRSKEEVPKLAEDHKLRPQLRVSRDLPKALQTFLNSNLPSFLPDYKNPCWYDGMRLNCLPYFYLIGVYKCGTTTVCSKITKHQQVVKVEKENFWISQKQFQGSVLTQALSPLSTYIELFQGGIKEVQRSVVSGFHPKVFGDCTSTTVFNNYYHRLVPRARSPLILQEPIFTNAEYIYHLNPATKTLATIRNPVDRLFSGYMFLKRSSYSLEGFDTYARDLVSKHRKCLQKTSLRACAYTSSEMKEGRIRIGIYHIFLKDFFDVFPRNQVMVVKLEDFSKSLADSMREVYSFLELEPMSDSELTASVGNSMEKPRNQRNLEKRKLGNMWNSTRQLLYDFYKPYNEELVKLLGPEFNYN